MKMNNNFKMYMKQVSDKMLAVEKRRLVRAGAIILSIITFVGGALILYKMNQEPTINNKPAKVVELKDTKKNKTNLFLEHVEHLKSGLYEVSALVFGEENMRMNETFGESSKDYVTVQGNFKIKYSIDITRIKIDYDFDKEEVIFKIPKDAIGVDSVELIGKIKEIEKYESFGKKLIDWIPSFNNDEYLKESAINQLLENSKIEAQNYDKNEVQTKADKAMKELIDTININKLKYRIEFVDNTKINIKK